MERRSSCGKYCSGSCVFAYDVLTFCIPSTFTFSLPSSVWQIRLSDSVISLENDNSSPGLHLTHSLKVCTSLREKQSYFTSSLGSTGLCLENHWLPKREEFFCGEFSSPYKLTSQMFVPQVHIFTSGCILEGKNGSNLSVYCRSTNCSFYCAKRIVCS